jgi:hypothetical protein
LYIPKGLAGGRSPEASESECYDQCSHSGEFQFKGQNYRTIFSCAPRPAPQRGLFCGARSATSSLSAFWPSFLLRAPDNRAITQATMADSAPPSSPVAAYDAAAAVDLAHPLEVTILCVRSSTLPVKKHSAPAVHPKPAPHPVPRLDPLHLPSQACNHRISTLLSMACITSLPLPNEIGPLWQAAVRW